jgi:hypothetical protein
VPRRRNNTASIRCPTSTACDLDQHGWQTRSAKSITLRDGLAVTVRPLHGRSAFAVPCAASVTSTRWLTLRSSAFGVAPQPSNDKNDGLGPLLRPAERVFAREAETPQLRAEHTRT